MLRDALRLVLELESYQIASRQRTKSVRGTHLEEGPTQQEQPTASSVTSSADVLQELDEAIRQCGKECNAYRKCKNVSLNHLQIHGHLH